MRLKNISYHPPVPTEQPTTAYRIRLTHGYKPMPTVQTTNALYARPLHTVHLQVTNAHCTTIYSKNPPTYILDNKITPNYAVNLQMQGLYTQQTILTVQPFILETTNAHTGKPNNAYTRKPNNASTVRLILYDQPMLKQKKRPMIMLGNQPMLVL